MLCFDGEITLKPEYAFLIEFCDYCVCLCEDVFMQIKDQERTPIEVDNFDAIKNISDFELEDKLYRMGKLDHYYAKKVFTRILLDFSLYMRQSVDNLRNFNPQIALTLCRKPLLDDLHYLEKLLVDKKSTIDDILNDEPKQVSTKDIKRVSKLVQEYGLFDVSEFSCGEDGLNLKLLCDKASHIVTDRHKLIKTKKGELNFIFMETDDVNRMTGEYLKFVPLILMHAVYVVFSLLKQLYKIDKQIQEYNEIIFTMNIFVYAFSLNSIHGKDAPQIDLKKLKLKCKHCGKETNFMALMDKKGRYIQCWECNGKTYYTGYINNPT